MKAWVCYDIETTGIDKAEDEILSLAIVDSDGAERTWLFKPERHDEWPSAMAINGITPDMVADAPAFAEASSEIAEIFGRAAMVVGYNHTRFDNPFLCAAGIDVAGKPQRDIMLEYAERRGEWNPRRRGWRWVKLVEACAEAGIAYENAHESLEDARATVGLMRWLDASRPLP